MPATASVSSASLHVNVLPLGIYTGVSISFIPFLTVFICDIAMLCCLCACKFIKNCCICSLRCIVGDVCLLLQLRYIEYERRKLPPTLLAESTDNTYQVRQTDKYEIKINPRHVLLLLFCLFFSSHGHFFSYVAFFALDECNYVGWSVFHLTCLVDWLGQRPEPCVQTPTPTPAPRSTFNMNIHALSSVCIAFPLNGTFLKIRLL